MLQDTGAEGVGLFRTELQFMIASRLPKVQEQIALYREAIRLSEGKPLVFRLLDVGGDKVIPYLRAMQEENPAMGFRSLRLALDRPGLLRTQVRALLHSRRWRPDDDPGAHGHRDLGVRRNQARDQCSRFERLIRSGGKPPSVLKVGAMIEVPSLLWELDRVLPECDFVSIGSNDLIMFLDGRRSRQPARCRRPTTRSPCLACAPCVTSSTWRGATASRSRCAASWPAGPSRLWR